MNFFTADLPSTLLLIGLGIVIGAALTKILNRGPNSTELQQKLEDTEEKLNNYQEDVSNHFQKTAELVNKLTLSYQEVHQHLSQGAQGLAKYSTNALENNSFKALSDNNTPADKQNNDADDSSTMTNNEKQSETNTSQ